jgi:hypothetical protein
VILLLKLVLAPGLIAAVTLAARRWGPRVGGALNALPVVAGPVLFLLALEHGEVFAARAAEGTLAALVGVAAFTVAYAWAARTCPWWASLLAGWAGFGLTAVLVQAVPWTAGSALAAALAGFGIAWGCLPAERGVPRRFAPPAWDLPLRIGAAVALILTVTGLASWLGPRLSGILTPFPVATAILLAATHAQQGTAAAIGFLRAFLPAMWGFALFCFVFALAAVALGRDLAFLAALAANAAAQGLFWLRPRNRGGRQPSWS